MTRIEELSVHLYGQLTDMNRTDSELALIESAIQHAYEEGQRSVNATASPRRP